MKTASPILTTVVAAAGEGLGAGGWAAGPGGTVGAAAFGRGVGAELWPVWPPPVQPRRRATARASAIIGGSGQDGRFTIRNRSISPLGDPPDQAGLLAAPDAEVEDVHGRTVGGEFHVDWVLEPARLRERTGPVLFIHGEVRNGGADDVVVGTDE